jgi:hypothetical protein
MSLNSLYALLVIVEGGSYGWQLTTLAGIGIILYAFGLFWFSKKDLPL